MISAQPRPDIGPARPWTFPTVSRGRLDNGLELVMCDLPGREVVAVTVTLDAPLTSEPIDLEGVAALTATALREGTAARSAEAFSIALDDRGATFRVQAGMDGIDIDLDVPVSRLADGLHLLAEAVLSPAFPAPDVDRLVRQRLDRIEQERADPTSRAHLDFAASIFAPGCRASRPSQGVRTTVERIDRDAIATFYSLRANPQTSRLTVAGDLDGVDIEQLVSDTFGAWTAPSPDGGQSPTNHMPANGPVAVGGRRLAVVDRPGAAQTSLMVGHAGPDRRVEDWASLLIGFHVLGGSMNSRIMAVLREEKGYTYGMQSMAHAYGRGGLLAISGSVQSEVTGDALADLFGIIEDTVDGGIRADERDAAVRYVSDAFPLQLQTARAMADQIVDVERAGLGTGFIDRNRAALLAATADSASAALARHLRLDDLHVIAVGDASVIVEQMQGLGPVEVIA